MDLLCSLSAHVTVEPNKMKFMQCNVLAVKNDCVNEVKNTREERRDRKREDKREWERRSYKEDWVFGKRKIELTRKGNLNDFK